MTDVITSPPYLNTTNYREDQWLRLWFLGGKPVVQYDRKDDRHQNKGMYWDFLQSSWKGLRPLLAEEVRFVIRIGGRQFKKEELREGLLRSLTKGLRMNPYLVNDGVTSEITNTQANAFRGGEVSRLEEHDFSFNLS